MKTDLKKLTLNQETLRKLTESGQGKPAFTTGLHCLETNFITCHRA